jgi:hypothetical protein
MSSEQPDQTNPKNRRDGGSDDRDDDAEDRAADDEDAAKARAEVEELEQETAQSQLSEQETAATGEHGGEGDSDTDSTQHDGDSTGASRAGAGNATATGGSGGTETTSTDAGEPETTLTPGGSDSPLDTGALHPRYRDGGQPPRSDPVSESSGRIGGWDGFSEAQVESSESLLDADMHGATQQNMEILSLSADADAPAAFATQYGTDGKDWEQAHSQMATFAFADAVGLRYPAHTFDEESKRVIVEDVADEGESTATLWDISDESSDYPAEWTDRVDADELLSHYAVHMLIGNNDLHGGNVIINDEGTVYTFDGDQSEQTFESSEEMRESMGAMGDSIRHLEDNRTEPLNISREDVVEEARSIAIEIQETGRKEEVLDHVGQYDEEFGDRSGRSYRDRLETNLDALIFDIPGV